MDRAYPPDYRDNDRAVLDDPELARWLEGELAGRLPREVEDREGRRWLLEGLNPRFRACRYAGGQAFRLHRDGAWSDAVDRRSFRTLMIYLNDGAEFTGGGTRFYRDRRGRPEGMVRVVAEQGAVVVFPHDLWHDGEAVTAGTKVVLRTDLMYRCQGGRPPDRHLGYVWDATLLEDGRLVTGSRDGTLGIWQLGEEVAPGGPLRMTGRIRGGAGSVTALAALDHGGFASGERSGRVRVWRRSGAGFAACEAEAGPGRPGAVLRLVRTPGGFAGSSSDGSVRWWSADGALIRSWSTSPGAWIRALGAGPEGSVHLADPRGAVLRFDPSGPVACGSLPAGVAPSALAVSGDGRVAIGCEGGEVLVLSGGGPRMVGRHQGAVRAAVFLDREDGARLATGGEDDLVRLWPGPERFLHGDFVTSLRVVGRSLVSTCYDETVRVLGF